MIYLPTLIYKRKGSMEDKTYKIMNFCTDFNFANLENNVVAMPNYENGEQIIILLLKKGNEHIGIDLKNTYQETFGCKIYAFEMSSWNAKVGFYTMLKFKE
jgi:hypothetical protein